MIGLQYIEKCYIEIMKENYEKKEEQNNGSITGLVTIVILLLLINILFLIWAIRSIFKCQAIKKWSVWVSVVLVLMLFMPYIGFAFGIAVIIYASMLCKEEKMMYKLTDHIFV